MAGEQVAVKVGGVITTYFVDDFFSNAGTSPKLVRNSSGILVWSPHNMFVNSATPATQNVTLIVGATYTMTVTGTGSLAGSSGASGTASAGSPVTFTATGTTGTFTVTGSLTTIQLNRGTVATAYLATGASARFGIALDYSADGTQLLGMLYEQAVTNICLWSNDFTDAAWVKTNMTAAKTATGPDGLSNSASTLTATAGNATVLQSITSASASRSVNCFIKRRTGSGTVELTQNNGTTWTAVTVTSSWTRVNVPLATLTNPIVGLRIVTSGDEVDVAYFQSVTATSVPSSPIPTFNVSVTRAADNYTFLLSSIPALGTEYSMYGRGATPAVAGNRAVVALSDGSLNEYANFTIDTTLRWNIKNLNVVQAAITAPGNLVPDVQFSGAGRVKANDFALSKNGEAVATDTSGTIPAGMDQVRFGSNTGAAASMPFRLAKMMIVPRAWNDTELQTQSAVT